MSQSPARRQLFKENNPNIPFPPEPITTRWGTWIQACEYYADHFDEVKSVIDNLNDKEAECIREAKKVFALPNICQDLAFIKANFVFIVDKIKQLETKGLEMTTCVKIYEDVRSTLNSMCNKEYLNKFEDILARNVGFLTVVEIKDILNGRVRSACDSHEYISSLSPSELASFKYAVLTSVDVERSFSMYKSVLTEKRRSFVFENLKHHLVLTCNSQLL